MKIKIILVLAIVFGFLPIWSQCDLNVEEYNSIDERVDLHVASVEFAQHLSKKNKLNLGIGIEGYDNYILRLNLDLKDDLNSPFKNLIRIYFDGAHPLRIRQFQKSTELFNNQININAILSDKEVNALYDHNIIKIDFLYEDFTYTFDLKSRDQSKHVALINCLDDKITEWKKVHPPIKKEAIVKHESVVKAEKSAQYDTETFKVVESMPRFPGCEGMDGTQKEIEDCAKIEMLKYIYTHLKYPAEARNKKHEGMVVIQYVISKEGMITEAKIVRDIGHGCGEAALKVVKGMNDLGERWRPGIQRGEPVKVLYTLPIRFNLGG